MKKYRIFGFILTTIVCSLLSTNVLAVPAPPYPVKVDLPDGTTITVKMTGDEYFMYTTTLDGYNIVMSEDGYYYYAEDQGGKLVSTGMRANDPGRRSAEERSVLSRVLVGAPSWAEAASQSSPLRLIENEMAALQSGKQMKDWSGNYKSLVILVNFQDIQFRTPNPRQAFDNLLNQEGYSQNGGTGSVNDYYYQNSNGRFNPTFDVVGPYTLPRPRSAYSWQSGNPGMVAQDAIVSADNDVDFSLYADGNTVPSIYIFYAGESNQTTSIWPHQSYVNYRVDGVTIEKYACSGEFETGTTSVMANIGTFCHEFGHVTDWPDFYDTDYEQNGQSDALSWYSLMDTGCYNNNGRTPPASTAMERMLKGWMTPKEFENSKRYTLNPVSEDEAYMIKTDNDGEYFLVEVRSGEDANGANVWDQKLAEELGITMPLLMVYHVDKSQNIVGGRPAADQWWPANNVNDFANHECFKVVKASRVNERYWGYPGPGNITSLSSGTNSEFRTWGNKSMIETFTDITCSGNTIVMDVFNGTAPTQYINIITVGDNYAEVDWSDFPHTGTFTVELFDEENSRLQQFETTDKTALLTMLKSETYYILRVTAKGTSNYDEIKFRTTAPEGAVSFPYLPLKGTYAVGEKIILRLSGMSDSVASSEWTLDGTALDSYIITPPAGKHVISLKVTLSDGNEEIFTKTITVQ